MKRNEEQDRQRIATLKLRQAEYDLLLAERRYAARDPDNHLMATLLEKAWEAALQRVERCLERIDRLQTPDANEAGSNFTRLAEDRSESWEAPRTTMRTRQQALAVIRSMAGRWSDQDIAASLNRMGLPTSRGQTWTARHVASRRLKQGIQGDRSAGSNGAWLTLRDVAAKLGVSHHQVRKLIKAGILASEQIMPDAPPQIRAADLESEEVIAALKEEGCPIDLGRRAAHNVEGDAAMDIVGR